MNIVKQKIGKTTYAGIGRLFVEDETLSDINLVPGSTYNTSVDIDNNIVVFYPDFTGNKVSSRTKTMRNGEKKVVPVIDKQDKLIRLALAKCSSIKITFYKDDNGGDRVVIAGIRDSAAVVREAIPSRPSGRLKSISFFSGTGISDSCIEKAGFDCMTACEYNPGEGSEERFAEIHKANHPNTVMFNIPAAMLNPNDFPKADLWTWTIPCEDYSTYSSTKAECDSIHQFLYLMKFFWGTKKECRPLSLLVENVPQFEKVSGRSLELALKDEGYFVNSTVLNSLDFGSRTERKRYFLVASVFEGFTFPEPSGRKSSPIIDDGVITLDELDFKTPEEDATLKHFVERNDTIKHNHKIASVDITKDTHFGVIPKNHHKKIPENLVKHPDNNGKYAFLFSEKHLKFLHGIDENYYLGESRKAYIEAIGQGVDCHVFYAIAKRLHDFLFKNIYGVRDEFRDLPIFQYLANVI